MDVLQHRVQHRERKVAFQCIASGALALDMVHVKSVPKKKRRLSELCVSQDGIDEQANR